MAFDLHFAPFLPEFAGFIDQKRTSLDAHELASIKHLFLDDIELFAEYLIGIGQEIKWKLLLVFEFFVRRNAVAGDTQDYCVQALELAMKVPKILAFRRTAGRRILGIEIEHQVLAT